MNIKFEIRILECTPVPNVSHFRGFWDQIFPKTLSGGVLGQIQPENNLLSKKYNS